jgi:PASTA domain/WD40-like Beta Propeller Repeat/Divergent InlB B-repeat domain
MGALLLCLCAVVGVASFSATASGAGDPAQFVAFSRSGSCAGFILETLTGTVTGCQVVPPDYRGGWFAVASDGSIVNNGGQNMGPVTLIRPDGSVAVLDSNAYDFDPALSPDGSKVVFARYEPQGYVGAWPSDLFVVNADGSGLKQVASGGVSQLSVPTFSPDGSSIAYSCEPSFSTGGPSSVGCGPLPDGSLRSFATFLMNADGTNKRVILLGQAQSLSWSSDGQWIATASVGPCACTNGDPSNTELFIYRTDGTDLFKVGDPSREVTHETDIYGGLLPQFTAGSSTQLVYYKPLDDSGNQGGWTYMINVDGTGRHELGLSSEGFQTGEVIPATSGAGPPPFVNVMRVLTVSRSGAGVGTVTSSPSGIDCGSTCAYGFDHESVVTLAATPSPDSTFEGWSTDSGCSGTGGCQVTLGADTTVTATFAPNCVVPAVKGKTLNAAKRVIKAHDCAVGKITYAASRAIKKGHVISQKPKPRTELKHGAKVSLVVSKGR